MDAFMTVPNFQKCQAAFSRWMEEHYDLNIRSVNTVDFDKEMYGIMTATKAACGPKESVEDMNNRALNALQRVYVDKLRLVRRTKPAFKPLDRDTQLFGDRPVTTSSGPGHTTAFTRSGEEDATLARAFDMMLNSRKQGGDTPSTPSQAFAPTKEEPMGFDDFSRRLKSLEDTRGAATVLTAPASGPVPANVTGPAPQDIQLSQVQMSQLQPQSHHHSHHSQSLLQSSIDAHGSVVSRADADPTALYRALQQQPDAALVPTDGPPAYRNQAMDVLLPYQPPAQQTAVATTFFTINGFDRDWAAYPQRYRFSVDMTQLGGTYRNVASVGFTTLIVPMEVGDSRSITHAVSKPIYHNDQRLAFPYLLLQVEELPSACDGLNQHVRKSVAQFVYDGSYKCPNGRGYIVMRPAHKDALSSRQVPSLQRMTLALVKPSGALFNASVDTYQVVKVEYAYYNSTYLQVVLDRYFDKNEFCLGDCVLLQGVSIVPPAVPSSSAAPSLSATDFNAITEFINRSEGHDILQLGEANTNGSFNSFYIYAPGTMDGASGKLVINKSQVDALREHNIAFPISPSQPRPIGRLINTSLQITVSGIISAKVAAATAM